MAETAQATERPQRWDVPFSREVADPAERRDMSEADLRRLLSVEPFAHMDPEAFPRRTPLRGILANDTRIRRYRNGDVVVREGDYGNSAFLILRGQVRVMLERLDPQTLGRREPPKRSIWRDLLQPLLNPRSPEVRDPRRYARLKSGGAGGGDGNEREVQWHFVQGVTNVLTAEPDAFSERRNAVMTEGELFGELAALGRIPRAATVVADGETELLEIRWQGLRDLRNNDDALRNYVDERFRQFGLAATLQASPLLAHLTDEQAQQVADEAEFETYGTYNWYGSYQQLRAKQQDPLAKEPVIARQGHYPNGLLLIRAGFARLSRQYGNGEQTFSYLGKGDVYGLAELCHNARSDMPAPLASNLRAIGYVDVVRIPTPTFERLILPNMPESMIPALPSHAEVADEGGEAVPVGEFRLSATGEAGGDRRLPPTGSEDAKIDPGMMEFLVEQRYINGTALMMIDMDRCTRCDDCVRACAQGHENNPVFVRHGPVYDNIMVANACMHCMDPVCMIGCPTGAIHRDEETGNVVINDTTCIGCGTCAASCPYDNIRMVETRDGTADDAPMVEPETGKPILKATKCDLCGDHHGGPACERACPHDALKRLDMRDMDAVSDWLNR